MTAKELFEQYRGYHPINPQIPIAQQVLAAGPPGRKFQICRVTQPSWEDQPKNIKDVWLRKADKAAGVGAHG